MSENERRGGGRPHTFTAWLRDRPDSGLDALFAARPDLITPVPADIGALAARAVAKPAVLRVLDRLDRFGLHVLEALVALGDDRLSGPWRAGGDTGTDPDALPDLLEAPAEAVRDTVGHLLATALVWSDGGRVRPVAVLRTILTTPLGLGPPLAALLDELPAEGVERVTAALGLPGGYGAGGPAERAADALARPDRLEPLIAAAGADARGVLERLAWGPPHGSVNGAARQVDVASAVSPIDRLLARGLLIATGPDTVTLPREVALHLRRGRLARRSAAHADSATNSTPDSAPGAAAGPGTAVAAAPGPPPLTGPQHTPRLALRAAAGQAFTAVRSVEELLELWGADPPAVLRNGGLGVRELRIAARALDSDEATTAVLAETAYAAGLLAADGDVDGEWLPSTGYDLWRAAEPAARWAALAAAWLRGSRVPSLSGSKDARGRTRNVLGEGLERRSAREVRVDVLDALAAAPEGCAPTAESVAERLAWLRPRRQGPAYTELVAAATNEAAVLGLTGRGALSPHGRALLAELREGGTLAEASAAEASLAPELPEQLDHFLVQGDLTAVAPGPLVPALARELALAADVESTGGATVYRFSDASVRRALDSGRGAAELTELLERHSTTPLPQPLRYLISDVARRHGRLRVGTASSYLRCDDPSVLAELAGDRRTADLALVRLAPTVLASRTARPVLLARLAELGYPAVPESVDGSVQLSRPEVRRSDAGTVAAGAAEPPQPGPAERAASVRAVRAGDEAANAERHPIDPPGSDPPRSAASHTLTVLSAAASQGRRVWIGYQDADGRASSRIVDPARVEGGFLTAYDATRAAVSRFAVHRITGVADIAAAEPAESGQRSGAAGSRTGPGPTRQGV
ncbi:XPB/Ssl2-like helicase family protein [Murinocardiopsis flavida]|uniref:XPB/Ssl2-like helicase family protein n=1 Tax=Murinocardiopsis flavida TaxID=645275 RepID=A0A2P8DR30_9ACTN|nr:helicase-associated domain-containing protein [Murinocardiopsis flavida]PSK99669.1 XPB/Ssl2-like helicase family protein [Murinocardiopsis flavida]